MQGLSLRNVMLVAVCTVAGFILVAAAIVDPVVLGTPHSSWSVRGILLCIGLIMAICATEVGIRECRKIKATFKTVRQAMSERCPSQQRLVHQIRNLTINGEHDHANRFTTFQSETYGLVKLTFPRFGYRLGLRLGRPAAQPLAATALVDDQTYRIDLEPNSAVSLTPEERWSLSRVLTSLKPYQQLDRSTTPAQAGQTGLAS